MTGRPAPYRQAAPQSKPTPNVERNQNLVGIPHRKKTDRRQQMQVTMQVSLNSPPPSRGRGGCSATRRPSLGLLQFGNRPFVVARIRALPVPPLVLPGLVFPPPLVLPSLTATVFSAPMLSVGPISVLLDAVNQLRRVSVFVGQRPIGGLDQLRTLTASYHLDADLARLAVLADQLDLLPPDYVVLADVVDYLRTTPELHELSEPRQVLLRKTVPLADNRLDGLDRRTEAVRYLHLRLERLASELRVS